jgi:hypothetical protein
MTFKTFPGIPGEVNKISQKFDKAVIKAVKYTIYSLKSEFCGMNFRSRVNLDGFGLFSAI